MTTDAIAALLKQSRTIAVVGLSAKPERDSHGVARYLQQHGYRIFAVNPTYAGSRILGELCHPNLTAAANEAARQGLQIDIVDCFRHSDAIMPIAEEAIAIGAKCLWLQLGVVNAAAVAKAEAAGLQVVQGRCIKIEHREAGLA